VDVSITLPIHGGKFMPFGKVSHFSYPRGKIYIGGCAYCFPSHDDKIILMDIFSNGSGHRGEFETMRMETFF